MIPRGAEGVASIAASIDDALAPAVAGTPAAADTRLAAMLVTVAAEEFERAVDVLVTDRRQLCQLLTVARPDVDDQLRVVIDERLADDAGGTLRVSALQKRADADVRALGQVMAHLETRPPQLTPERLSALLDQCWNVLESYTQRRRIGVLA